jgi:hypothetical protein
MNALSFGTAIRGGLGIDSDEPKPDNLPVDTAWAVLEAANDLGDHATVQACRRVIDASLNSKLVSPSDLHIVLHYFR